MTEKRALPKIPFFYWNLTRKITTRVPNQSRASTKYRKHLWPHQCRQTSLEVAELLLKKLPRPLPNKGNGPRYWRWVANHGVLIRLRLTKTGVCRYSLIGLKPTKNLFIGSTPSDSCGSTWTLSFAYFCKILGASSTVSETSSNPAISEC